MGRIKKKKKEKSFEDIDSRKGPFAFGNHQYKFDSIYFDFSTEGMSRDKNK